MTFLDSLRNLIRGPEPTPDPDTHGHEIARVTSGKKKNHRLYLRALEATTDAPGGEPAVPCVITCDRCPYTQTYYRRVAGGFMTNTELNSMLHVFVGHHANYEGPQL